MQETRKILIFGMTAETGGVESFIMNYVRHMTGKGVVFHFLTYNARPAFGDEIEALGGKIIIIPGRGKNPLKCISAIKRVLAQTEYDAVWSNLCYLSDILVLKYAKKAGVPVRVIHAHNNANMSGRINGYLHRYNRNRIGKIATDFWCCSDSAGEFFYPESIRSSEKYRVIPNAVDTGKYAFDGSVRTEKRKELNLEDKFVIGNVGRLHFQKNHMFMLEIFQQICRVRQNVVLLLVGDGELRPQIEAKIDELGLRDKVLLLGRRNDVSELMCAMDVFLLPSLFEGFPVSLVEAQTSGLPCFTSKDRVTDDAAVTDLLKFIKLSDAPEVWADAILNVENHLRTDRSQDIKQAGYDIRISAEQLIRFLIDE